MKILYVECTRPLPTRNGPPGSITMRAAVEGQEVPEDALRELEDRCRRYCGEPSRAQDALAHLEHRWRALRLEADSWEKDAAWHRANAATAGAEYQRGDWHELHEKRRRLLLALAELEAEEENREIRAARQRYHRPRPENLPPLVMPAAPPGLDPDHAVSPAAQPAPSEASAGGAGDADDEDFPF